ncbi:MAG: response regulator [Kofleriaceae bacterium]
MTGRRLLLVEDNEMNRDMLARRLRRLEFVVELAVDGEDGVAKAVADPPDLVLMDLSLPKLDGCAAARQLRAIPQTAKVPIIALTAHAMETDRQRALDAGCNDFDTKPVEIHRLMDKIRALLEE